MTQKQMVNAYSTLTAMGASKLPISTAYKLFQLRKRLEPTYNFCLEQERMIIERYEGRLEGGTLYFGDADSAQKAKDEFSALNSMEVECCEEPVVIRMEDLETAALSMDDIASLDGFVNLI